MAQGIYKITEDFERLVAEYTGAPYAMPIDNCCNALFLALTYERVRGTTVRLPSRTYPGVPCEVIHAGGIVDWYPVVGKTIKGAYQLSPTRVWDAALSFTSAMYLKGTHMCVSFTGPYKHLKLGKGGAILTDDYQAMLWFKRARFSGRRECSYHDDHFDMLGWNFYMMPDVAARGVLLMQQFYERDGTPKVMEDIEMSYPDLSKFPIYAFGGDR